jgi:hypothetical protein
MYLFGIGVGMEHHIPPNLMLSAAFAEMPKEKTENWLGSETRVMMIKPFFCLHF